MAKEKNSNSIESMKKKSKLFPFISVAVVTIVAFQCVSHGRSHEYDMLNQTLSYHSEMACATYDAYLNSLDTELLSFGNISSVRELLQTQYMFDNFDESENAGMSGVPIVLGKKISEGSDSSPDSEFPSPVPFNGEIPENAESIPPGEPMRFEDLEASLSTAKSTALAASVSFANDLGRGVVDNLIVAKWDSTVLVNSNLTNSQVGQKLFDDATLEVMQNYLTQSGQQIYNAGIAIDSVKGNTVTLYTCISNTGVFMTSDIGQDEPIGIVGLRVYTGQLDEKVKGDETKDYCVLNKDGICLMSNVSDYIGRSDLMNSYVADGKVPSMKIDGVNYAARLVESDTYDYLTFEKMSTAKMSLAFYYAGYTIICLLVLAIAILFEVLFRKALYAENQVAVSEVYAEKNRLSAEKLAARDLLTECFNRAAFFQDFSNAKAEDNVSYMFTLVNLDGLGKMNGVYGVAKTDGYIMEISDQLFKMSGCDAVYRTDGNEFILVSQTPTDLVNLSINENRVSGLGGLLMQVTSRYSEVFEPTVRIAAGYCTGTKADYTALTKLRVVLDNEAIAGTKIPFVDLGAMN